MERFRVHEHILSEAGLFIKYLSIFRLSSCWCLTLLEAPILRRSTKSNIQLTDFEIHMIVGANFVYISYFCTIAQYWPKI